MLKGLLRKIVPVRVKRWLRAAQASLSLAFLRFFCLTPLLSTCYYALFSSQFRREQFSVLKGRVKYEEQHRKQLYTAKSSALLRRNTHRLEKGLIMQPRKPVFAEQYIQETVQAFAEIACSEQVCKDELKWATDVLGAYFSTVTLTPKIEQAEVVFRNTGKVAQNNFVPYKDAHRMRSEISTDDLKALFMQRRSTRWFKPQPVENEKLDTAIEMASLAPSACNRQPFSFFIANDPEKAREVAGFAVGTGGFAHNIPCIVAVVGDLSAYPYEKDRHLIYIDGALASMQFMLALETMGLASCPLNWPDIEMREQLISKRLNLVFEQRVVMLIAVGYAQEEGMIPFSQKKNTSSLRQDID
ncbi:nitroreductase family protein [Lacimicrobium sp. SS2-24]|uniref:nitroreductase family protein n=1 Tax=Lacimicrobium sp. SS2-24 TaxID=2005569 RepID=UPI000B4B599B|nr:nitroreductase family protein [Lacimicrobium sp. SS2-24]